MKIFRLRVPKQDWDWSEQGTCEGRVMTENGIGGFPALDMLRYDGGRVIKTEKEKDGKEAFIVESIRYTKARWDSFLVRTELLNERTVQKTEFDKINEKNKRWLANLSDEMYESCENTGTEMPISRVDEILGRGRRKRSTTR